VITSGNSELGKRVSFLDLPVENPSVVEVLRSARAELEELVAQRAEITRRIGTTKQAIIGLARMFGGNALQSAVLELMEHRSTNRQSGFTRACRYLLTESNGPMTSADVCEGLRRKFPELAARHKDLTASVTTVMNRLVHYGEASVSDAVHGRRAWNWVAEAPEQVAASPLAEKHEELAYPPPIMSTDATNAGSHRIGRTQL
jgi:hypothetical protein